MGDVRYGDANTLLEKEPGVRRALLTTSCTHALELAALLLEIQPYCVIYGNGGGQLGDGVLIGQHSLTVCSAMGCQK